MRNFIMAAALLVSANAAQAVTYNAVADFSLTNPGAWDYGVGNGGLTFTSFTSTTNNCYGQGFDCYYSTDYQGAGIGTGTIFTTVTLDPDALWLHPGDGVVPAAPAPDTIVQFTTQATGVYSLSASFGRLSSAQYSGPSDFGNGVNVAIYLNGSQLFGDYLSPSLPSNTSFGQNLALTVGDQLRFVVNNNGSYGYDSTGLQALIGSVPEPASWAMMVGGFGLLGAGMRASRRRPTFA